MLIDEGKIYVTDGKSKAHLNYGREEQTIESLLNLLSSKGYESTKDTLDNSCFIFGETTFCCHLKPNKLSATEQDLVISLEASDLTDLEIESIGPDNERPTGTFYLTIELGNVKIEALKKQITSRIETIASLSKLSEGEIENLIGGSGVHSNLPGLFIKPQDGNEMDDELPVANEEDELAKLELHGEDWGANLEVGELIIPEENDEFWIRFDSSKNNFKTKPTGIICESIEDFVEKSKKE